VKGGIFIAASFLRIALRRSLLELNRSPALGRECSVVLKWLERLILIEAIKNVTDDAVMELNQLLEQIAGSLDQPAESLRWGRRLSQKIAAISSNSVLTAIYTALLNVTEGESEDPWRSASHSRLAEALATYRRVVDAIAAKSEERLGFLSEAQVGTYAYR
jgi:DNA-binding FadR family transcriptional regulator